MTHCASTDFLACKVVEGGAADVCVWFGVCGWGVVWCGRCWVWNVPVEKVVNDLVGVWGGMR